MSGLGEGVPRTARAIWRATLPVWAGLMVLLGLTLGGAFLPLGRLNLVLALAIGTAKALLVAVFFMHLRRPDPLLRLAATTALFFVCFLALLTFADVLTRPPPTLPGTVTPTTFGPEPPATGERMFP